MNRALFGLVFGVCLVSVSWLVAADWRQWRGDDRNGVALSSRPLRSSLPSDGLKPLWKSESIAAGFEGGWGSPIVADGKVYLFTHSRSQQSDAQLPPRKFPYLPDDKRGHLTPKEYEEYEVNRRQEDFERGKAFNYRETITCIDAQSGQTVWKSEQPSIYTRFLHSGTPTLNDGKLLILGAGRKARCIDAQNGKELWATSLSGEFHDEYFMSSFVVVDGVAAVLCGYLVGLDAQTGEILWKGDDKATRGTHSSPVVWRGGNESLLVVNVAGSDTIAVEPRSGRERWRVKSEASLSTPVIVGDLMITLGGSRRGGMRCFRISSDKAEQLWVYNGLGDKGSSPVVVGDYVYAQGEKRLACVELASGTAAWTAQLDLTNPQYTSLVAVDGKVLYAYDGLLCFAANPQEYQPLVQAKFDRAGLIASEAFFRQKLGLDKLEKEAGGLEKSVKLFKQEVGDQGPLPCTSPAIVDGRLYLRLRNSLACYDLAP